MIGCARTLLAVLFVVSGIGLAAFGGRWAPAALGWIPDDRAGPWLELLLPFLPMVLILAGAVLYRPRRRA